jgi:hypothetical protein
MEIDIIAVIISLTNKRHISYSFPTQKEVLINSAKQQFGTAEASLPPNCG